MKRLLFLCSLLFLLAAGCNDTYDDTYVDPSTYDCPDLGSQSDAQEFYENNDPSSDPYHLDRDGDGVACETN